MASEEFERGARIEERANVTLEPDFICRCARGAPREVIHASTRVD